MTCWAVLPVKAPAACKSRLRTVLDDTAREALVAAMVRHVCDVAVGVDAVDRVLILGPSRHGLPESVPLLGDPGEGLNAAMSAAVGAALRAGVARLLLVSPDLPRLEPGDLATLATLDPGQVGIAPDRAGTGTNALSLPLPAARDFTFGYGADSFVWHVDAVSRIGLAHRVIATPGLSFDIDTPADFALLADRHADTAS